MENTNSKMKIIHCADLHLDSKMESNLSTAKARERRREILNTFERMVDFAKREEIDCVLIAGDMFDTGRISSATKSRILNAISKCSQVQFLYLAGNHDEVSFVKLLENPPSNLKVFGDSWTSFEFGDVCISGMNVDKYTSASMYHSLVLNPQKINIVALHGQAGKYDGAGSKDCVNLTKLQNKGIDYLALGHIHSYSCDALDRRGIWCYCGCLEGRGFDECGEKGFVQIEVAGGKVSHKFVPFASRQLVECSIDISGYENWFEVEERALGEVAGLSREFLLRIRLIGKYRIGLEKHIDMLEKKLSDFYFAAVVDKSTLEIKAGDFENDVSLRGEFIRQVLASDLSESEKESVVLVGLKYLEEGGE